MVDLHTKAIMPNKKVAESIIEPAISIADSVSIRVIRADKVVEEYPAQERIRMPNRFFLLFRKTFELFRLLNKKSARKGSRNISRFFKERPSEGLIGLCEKYVGELKKLVDECEQLFNRD